MRINHERFQIMVTSGTYCWHMTLCERLLSDKCWNYPTPTFPYLPQLPTHLLPLFGRTVRNNLTFRNRWH